MKKTKQPVNTKSKFIQPQQENIKNQMILTGNTLRKSMNLFFKKTQNILLRYYRNKQKVYTSQYISSEKAEKNTPIKKAVQEKTSSKDENDQINRERVLRIKHAGTTPLPRVQSEKENINKAI
jgi:hypothetical protein